MCIVLALFKYKKRTFDRSILTLTTCRSVERDNINLFVAISQIAISHKFSPYFFFFQKIEKDKELKTLNVICTELYTFHADAYCY